MIKLSICIATYNRAYYIQETLQSIIPQLSDDVELLVVDGASTDNTEEVVISNIKKCKQIRYVRLPVKGGVDYDYNQAIELASGEYCWLFTDDDKIKQGAVHELLYHIKLNYDLIIVNSDVLNADFSKSLEERRLKITDNKLYKPIDFEKFFIENSRYISYIGCVVIKRLIWIEREKEKYYGSEFIHMGVIFQKKFKTNILVIATPHISIRLGNAQWTSRAFDIWNFKWPNLLWSFDSFSDTAKSKLSVKEPWRQLIKLASQRSQGNFGLKEYSLFIRPKLSSLFEKTIYRTITILPGYMLNFLAIIFYVFIFPNDKLSLYSLKKSKYYLLNSARYKKNERDQGSKK